jgi:hypothetical protein
MDVYSDRISVDREEQERLRFSADDIVRLPVHTAINLWVARGTPRTGFYARTLPMEGLYDRALAGHHLAAQRERGGHYLAHLPAPLAADTCSSTQPNGSGPGTDRGGGDLLQLPDRRRPGRTDE